MQVSKWKSTTAQLYQMFEMSSDSVAIGPDFGPINAAT